ncbi:hypothetical protein A2U01_0081375, partial [Trifolium medium]|nr:hypothetical protein [Trifolium medium]
DPCGPEIDGEPEDDGERLGNRVEAWTARGEGVSTENQLPPPQWRQIWLNHTGEQKDQTEEEQSNTKKCVRTNKPPAPVWTTVVRRAGAA